MSVSASVNSRTVLYVEDEECDRMFMEAAFRKAGLTDAFRAVVDGKEAKDYLAGSGLYGDRAQHPLPAVVLLDLNMPAVSGFEVLEWMRKHPELAELPVVIFTSSSRDEDKTRAKELGAKDYVEKPSTMAKFGEVVQRVRERWLSAVDG